MANFARQKTKEIRIRSPSSRTAVQSSNLIDVLRADAVALADSLAAFRADRRSSVLGKGVGSVVHDRPAFTVGGGHEGVGAGRRVRKREGVGEKWTRRGKR